MTAEPVTVPVPRAPLLRALQQMKCFVGNDGTLPVLHCIGVEVEGDLITLTATDRYAVGHARIVLDSPAPRPAKHLLHSKYVGMVTTLLRSRDLKAAGVVDLTFTESETPANKVSRLEVASSVFGAGVALPGHDGELPNCRELIRKSMQGKPTHTLPGDFTPAVLARVLRAFAIGGHGPVAISTVESERFGPCLVHRPSGDRDLVAAVMPTRRSSSDLGFHDVWAPVFEPSAPAEQVAS